ncbi:GntR family transcriptional regulator [Pseudochelatococcus sp. B33]
MQKSISSADEEGPLYRVYASRILAAIEDGRFEPGLVLLEGRLSAIFETSRATIRKALNDIADQGGIRRFDGRGFVVAGGGDVEPIRRPIGADEITAENGPAARPAADNIIAEVEAAVMTAVAFGHYRIDEQKLAGAFGVSRPVAREVLWRLREAGLVEKELHSPWLAGPVTARAVAEDRELRMLLEPHALKLSAPMLDRAELLRMRDRVTAARRLTGKIPRAAIEAIEQDLHITCVRHYRNDRVKRVMRTGRLPMIVDALFAEFIGIYPDDPAFVEHGIVLDQLLAEEFDAAAASHSAHLRQESKRTLDRLKVMSVLPEPEVAPYLERIV